MLARPHIKHLDVGHIILLRNSHTFFIARPDTILGSCPVSPTSTIPGSQRRNNHISFFPSIKARNYYHPLFMRCKISSHKSWRNLIYWQKSTCTQIPLSAQPDLASMQSSPLLERSGRRTSLFALQAKKSGGFLADSTH